MTLGSIQSLTEMSKVTGHERPIWGEDVQFYSSFNFDAKLGWVVKIPPRPLHPQERPGTRCTGGWVGPRAGLDGYGNPRPHRDSIHGPSSP